MKYNDDAHFVSTKKTIVVTKVFCTCCENKAALKYDGYWIEEDPAKVIKYLHKCTSCGTRYWLDRPYPVQDEEE